MVVLKRHGGFLRVPDHFQAAALPSLEHVAGGCFLPCEETCLTSLKSQNQEGKVGFQASRGGSPSSLTVVPSAHTMPLMLQEGRGAGIWSQCPWVPVPPPPWGGESWRGSDWKPPFLSNTMRGDVHVNFWHRASAQSG